METTDLGKWMITNGGEYNPDTTYEQLTMILYQNSTYITLRTVTGIIPNNDKINYILMAQGFSANALADVVAKDTYGAIGNVGESVSAQSLIDYLTNEVVNNLIKKTSISTVQVNSNDMVPSSSLSYSMQRAIDNINSNLSEKANTTDFNTFKNMIGFVGLSGISFGYDGTFVNIWWLFGPNKEYGHALNIKISDGTLQFYNLVNGSWNIAWTK